MLLILLGVAGIFYLDLATRRMQNGVDVLAQLAAQGPDWRAEVAAEDRRTNCNADPQMPEVIEDGKTVLLRWTCHLRTDWIFDGTEIVVESKAVLAPSPSPSP